MFLYRLFGKSPQKEEESPSITNNVIDDLKSHIVLLDKRNTHLENKIQQLVGEIRTTANKKRALIMLDTKKQYDSEIEKNDGIKYTIEKQINSLENSVINVEVAKCIHTGNVLIKNTQSKINIDVLEDLMDDVVEQTEISQSISNIFTQKMNELYDDDELLAELDELQAQPEKSQLILPTAPLNLINKKVETEEEKEEEELQNIRLAMLS